MATAAEIIANIERGQSYMSASVSGDLNRAKKKTGCFEFGDEVYQLNNIINSLKDRRDQSLIEDDPISNKLNDCLIEIIGDYTIPSTMITGYWWTSDDGLPLTDSQIVTKNSFQFEEGQPIRVPLDVDTFSFYGIAYPISQTTKTKYQDVAVSSNKGDIGGIDNLLGSAVLTTLFKQHNTNYPSIQTTDLILS